jgi:hypothetical protein
MDGGSHASRGQFALIHRSFVASCCCQRGLGNLAQQEDAADEK